MESFYMLLTLSSLAGPQVQFMSQPHPWNNQSACILALPKMQSAVSRLIYYAESALELFGQVIGGRIKPGYFVSQAECRSAELVP